MSTFGAFINRKGVLVWKRQQNILRVSWKY